LDDITLVIGMDTTKPAKPEAMMCAGRASIDLPTLAKAMQALPLLKGLLTKESADELQLLGGNLLVRADGTFLYSGPDQLKAATALPKDAPVKNATAKELAASFGADASFGILGTRPADEKRKSNNETLQHLK